jgi:hypothetical protein
MMHTYLRIENGVYDIGQWLPNREGVTSFNRLFSVHTLKQAFTAVNILNGGTRVNPNILGIFNERE